MQIFPKTNIFTTRLLDDAFIFGSQSYKGVLFSFLKTLSVPTVPNALHEVVQSENNYLIVTINEILILTFSFPSCLKSFVSLQIFHKSVNKWSNSTTPVLKIDKLRLQLILLEENENIYLSLVYMDTI